MPHVVPYMTRCHCSHMCLHLVQGVIHIDRQTARLPNRIYPIRCPFSRLWCIYFTRCVHGLHDSLPLQPYVSTSSSGGDSHRLQTFRLPECQIARSHLNPIRCTFPRLWHTCFIRCVQGLHDSLPFQPYVSASNPGGDSH